MARSFTAYSPGAGTEAADPDALPEVVSSPRVEIESYTSGLVRGAGLPVSLTEAMHYALLGGGKRIRPLLVWHCAAAAGADPRAALPACAAIELVHAFSLVHDDLPAMDDDDMRRGRPTLHKATSEAMAILAGDAMLAFAFQVLLSETPDRALGAALAAELAQGTSAMIAGQVYDTLGSLPASLSSLEKLRLIHRNKTGALIRGACLMGARFASVAASPRRAPADAVERLTEFGERIGLMFQVVDDVLDVTQTAEHTGKRTNKDAAAGKLTYPLVLGLEASREEIGRLQAHALESLAGFGPEAEPLRRLTEYLAVRTR